MYDTRKTQSLNQEFGAYNEGLGICPEMSSRGKPVYCTKDCAKMYDGYKCPYRQLTKILVMLEEKLKDDP